MKKNIKPECQNCMKISTLFTFKKKNSFRRNYSRNYGNSNEYIGAMCIDSILPNSYLITLTAAAAAAAAVDDDDGAYMSRNDG
jgi:hypothetical protein